jgi:hypothetical protein
MGLSQSRNAVMPDFFYNCWKASLEEDDNVTGFEIKAYRPCDYKEFRPSLYRQTFSFNRNGTCLYLRMAANDAHYNAEGKWYYRRRDGLITIKDSQDKVVFKIRVRHLDKNKMKISVKEYW